MLVYQKGTMYLFIIFSVLSVSAASKNDYTVKQIQTGAGLFYDYLYDFKFSINNWKIITFIELDWYIKQQPYLNNDVLLAVKTLKDKCTHVMHYTHSLCDAVIQRQHTVQLKLNVTEEYVRQLKAISTQPEIEKDIKQKRDVFNDRNTFIGKSFFTSLSDEESRLYNNKIDNMLKEKKNFVSDLENLTHILPAEVERFKKILIEYSTIGNSTLGWFYIRLENFNKWFGYHMEKEKQVYWELYYQTILYLDDFGNVVDGYNHFLKIVIDSINLSKLNILHPEILSSEKLEGSLEFFAKHSGEFNLPMNIRDAVAGHLSKISQIDIGYDNGRLFVLMRIPLTEDKIYHIHKLRSYPIAQQLGNNTIGSAWIKPRANYLILSSDQSQYTLVKNKIDLPFCQASVNIHICESLSYPMYESSHQAGCEISLITKINESPLLNCDIKISRHFTPYWKKLSNERGWLYSLPGEQEIHILCGDKKKKTIVIRGVGILRIQAGCHARINYGTIFGQQVVNIDTIYEFKTTATLNVTKLLPEIVDFTIGETNYSSANPAVLIYDISLKEIRKEILDQKEKINEKNHSKNIIFRIILGEIIMATILTSIISFPPIVIIIKKILSFFKKEKCHIDVKPVPTSISYPSTY